MSSILHGLEEGLYKCGWGWSKNLYPAVSLQMWCVGSAHGPCLSVPLIGQGLSVLSTTSEVQRSSHTSFAPGTQGRKMTAAVSPQQWLWQWPLSGEDPGCLCCHVPQPLPQCCAKMAHRVGRVSPGTSPGFLCLLLYPALLLPSSPGFGIYRPELGSSEALSFLVKKLPSSSVLHKATLFSANPPRSRTHFFQVTQQHVDGRGPT